MKALTVQQPWAWAVTSGHATVENRTRLWKYRGPLAIHAGARPCGRGTTSPLILDALRPVLTPWEQENRRLFTGDHGDLFVHDAIIGVVDLVDVHHASGCCKPWGEQSHVEQSGRLRAIVHLVLDDPRPVDPIPCRGRLGLWTLPPEVEAQLRTAVRGTHHPRQTVAADVTASPCPVCGARDVEAVHVARCTYRHTFRRDVQAHAGVHGIPEVAAADLLAHLCDCYSDGDQAHRAARTVIDLGWRPVVGAESDHLWSAETGNGES